MHHLIVAERAGHTHIGFITQHIIGPRQLSLDRRHHQFGSAGAQANYSQTATGPANRFRFQRRRGNTQHHAIARFTPGNRQQRCIAAHKPQRHRQLKGRFTQRCTGHQGFRCDDARQRLTCQPGLVQRFED